MPAVVSVIAAACTSAGGGGSASSASSGASPTPLPARITLVLSETPDGGCCVVTTVNPQPTAQTVVCFAEAFDDGGRLLATHVIPPLPEGHRRSSGFAAPPGRSVQGPFELPAELLRGTVVTTCRPAAWHGGAPI